MAEDGSIFVVGPGGDLPAAPPPGAGEGPSPGPAGAPPAEGSSFGRRYRVSGEIGRGGMGVILDGRDLEIRRELAIKVMNVEAGTSAERLARFVEEARIQGQLEHPNICPVHELGTDAQGRPYFTMKKVRGRSLAELLREARAAAGGKGPSLAQLLGIFSKVCDAVAFAHARGVIHRDLKPENVMIGEFGEVLVMDWGLAKVRGAPAGGAGGAGDGAAAVEGLPERGAGGALRSSDGAVIGTPFYMSPEQARGDADQVDERSDVYALGGILYSILTLEPPIEGGSHREILDKAARGEVVPPSRRAPSRGIPPDLEAAAMKALAADPAGRYPDAKALQADVTAFLEGRTLAAARYTPLQVAAKWARRNRVFALTASVSAGLLLAFLAVYLVNLSRERTRTAREAERAEAAAREARAAERETEARRRDALLVQGEALGKSGRWQDARRRYHDAAKLSREIGASTFPSELGDWDVHRVLSLSIGTLFGHQGAVRCVEIAADGRAAVSADADGKVIFWDLWLETPVRWVQMPGDPLCAALSPDGSRAAVACRASDGGHFVGIVDARTGADRGRLRCGAPVHRIAFGGSPARVTAWEYGLMEGGAFRVWDPEAGGEVRTIPFAQGACLALSRSGARAVIKRSSGGTDLVDLESGGVLRSWDAIDGSIRTADLSPDGKRVLFTYDDGVAALWSAGGGEGEGASGGEPVFRGGARTYGAEDGLYRAARFSPEGTRAAIACRDATVRLLDLDSGREIRHFQAGDLHFTAQSLDEQALQPLDPLAGLSFSPDGRLLLAAMRSSQLTLWDARIDGDAPVGMLSPEAQVDTLALSPDGSLALLCQSLGRGEEGVAMELWDLDVLRRLRSFRFPPGASAEASWTPVVCAMAFVPGSARAVTGDGDGNLALWDLASGGILRRARTGIGVFRAVAVTPDGKRAFACGIRGKYAGQSVAWDLEGEAKDPRIVEDAGTPVSLLALSPDGRTLLTAEEDGPPRLWDARSCAPLRDLEGPAPRLHGALFVPGTDLVAAWVQPEAEDPEAFRLWSVPTGKREARPPSGIGQVRSAGCSPDGAYLLAYGLDAVRLWEVRTGLEIRAFPLDSPIQSPRSPDATFALRSDGTGLVCIGGDGNVWRWRFDAPARFAALLRPVADARLALAKDRGNGRAHAAMGDWLLFRGFPDLALVRYERARALGAADPPALPVARARWMTGDLAGAARELERALDRREAPEDDLRLRLGAARAGAEGGAE